MYEGILLIRVGCTILIKSRIQEQGSCRIALPSPQRTMASLDVDSKERGASDRAFIVLNQESQRLEYLRII
jgi:hypothetical protein